MTAKKHDLIIIVFFVLLSLLFYLKLFFPEPRFIFTPDLGRSDIFQFNTANKFLLALRIKSFSVPLWTGLLGTGAPLVAETQIGAFFLPDLLLYYFLPFVYAFNLAYVLHTFLALSGTYLLARHFQQTRLSAIFTSTVFAFSGSFIFRLTLSDYFAGAALLPWILFSGLKAVRENNRFYILLFAFIVSLQIFGGHWQIVFMSHLSLGILLAVGFRDKLIFRAKRYFSGFGLALLLAAIQILPALEYKNQSVRAAGLSFTDAVFNSLEPKYLLNLIFPYFFGSPKDAGWALFRNGGFDIFWEKAGYVGPVVILLMILRFWQSKKIAVPEKPWLVLLIFSLLLSLGKYSPFFWFFMVFPFNLFRVPARYLLTVDLSLAFLAGMALDKMQKDNSFLKSLLVAFTVVSGFIFAWSYHLTVPARDALKQPRTATYLKNSKTENFRIMQIGSGFPYMRELTSRGWRDQDYYLFALNSLDANSNVFLNLSSVNIYQGILTSRQKLFQEILEKEAVGDLNKLTAVSSPLHKNLLSKAAVDYLISPFKFKNNDYLILDKIDSSPSAKFLPFYLYEIKSVKDRFRLARSAQSANNTDDALTKLREFSTDPDTEIIENLRDKVASPSDSDQLAIREITDEKISLEVSVSGQSLLIAADSFYPGWKAFIDQQETSIYPANVNQRAVLIPAGRHRVEMIYEPGSYFLGRKISFAGCLLWTGLLMYGSVKWLILKIKRRNIKTDE